MKPALSAAVSDSVGTGSPDFILSLYLSVLEGDPMSRRGQMLLFIQKMLR